MLPEWLEKESDGVYIINADILYPQLLAELESAAKKITVANTAWLSELKSIDKKNITQYWIEVIYQMSKLELRRIMLLNGESAWPDMIKIKGDKSKWALTNYPTGRGIEKATFGKEAREIYRHLKGFIPN